MDLWDKVRHFKPSFTIPEVWAALGYPDPPARDGIVVKSPFRDDGKRGSFQILKGGTGYRDYGGSAGDGPEAKGDAVSFIMAALGVDKTDAARRFVAMAGGDPGEEVDAEQLRKAKERPRPVEVRGTLTLPENLGEGSPAWREALARLRGLDVGGIDAAVAAGVLRFAPNYTVPLKGGREFRCAAPVWAVLDSATECNAQVRRLDGAPWFDDLKALTVGGSWGSWPIGLDALGEGDDVLLCEGGPDLLAGYDMRARGLVSAVPVGMLGAGQPIPGGALPLFRRRRVLIAAHHDRETERRDGTRVRAGWEAAQRWAAQLHGVARSVHVAVGFEEGQDLNDWLRAGGTELRTRTMRPGRG